MNLIWGKLRERIEQEIHYFTLELDAYCAPGDEYDMYSCGSLMAYRKILKLMNELEETLESGE